LDYKSQAEEQLLAEDFDKYKLPDISGIVIPDSDPKARIAAFLQAVGNPYLFRVGDIGVHVSFSGSHGDTLQRRVCRLLLKTI